MLNEGTCKQSLFTCMLNEGTCKQSLFTCMLNEGSCKQSLFTCMLSERTCKQSLFADKKSGQKSPVQRAIPQKCQNIVKDDLLPPPRTPITAPARQRPFSGPDRRSAFQSLISVLT